jgi:acyl carrier protein
VTDDEILETLRRFVADELLGGQDEGLDASTPLLEWGVIDSISVMRLRAFVEKELGVKIPTSDLKSGNLKTLRLLTDLIVRLRG